MLSLVMATDSEESRHETLHGEPGEITRWLEGLRSGEAGALERLVPLLYEELRRMARDRLRGERSEHTLSPTALVHEAYLRLSDQRRIPAGNRLEFFAAASRTMFRVLVDHARGRSRRKRGGAEAPVPLDEVAPFLSDRGSEEVLEMADALKRLEAMEPRAARIVELKFFAGLSGEEIAQLLGVSGRTVERDWQAARAWLRKEVGAGLVASAAVGFQAPLSRE